MSEFNDRNGRSVPESLPPVDDAHEGPAAPRHEFFRLLTFTALTVGLIVLCAWLAVPFLPAITWGVALAIIAWPMHRWISARVPRAVVASLLSSTAVVVVIVVPGVFVSYQLAREAAAIAVQVQDGSGRGIVHEKLADTPGIGHVVRWMDSVDLQVEAEAGKIIARYTQEAAALVHGSLTAAIQFLVAIFVLYYLFLDRGTFLHGFRDILPLSKDECDKVFTRAVDSVHGSVYATMITSLIDATGGGLMFWALGLPAPLLWGVVIFVLSILPVVGAAMVWFPAVVYLVLTDRWLEGLGLLSWGLLSFIIVDNLLYVRLAGQRMRMHEVPALIAFLGGIAVFGVSGMILGPAILGVTIAFLAIWKQRLSSDACTPPLVDQGVIVPPGDARREEPQIMT